MKRYYSKFTNGFYVDIVHGELIPDDAIEERLWGITYDDLMVGQENGALITSTSEGKPTLDEQPKPTASEMAKAQQSELMSVAGKQIAIIKPAVDGGYAKPEDAKLLSDWQRYRYELTLVPEQKGWPDLPQWPLQPESVVQ